MTDVDEGPAAIGSRRPKVAVIVIHGIGEQRPMETITRFVDAVWRCDKRIGDKHDKQVFSKPDTITGSFELRRLSTRNVALQDGEMKRVDFLEFYWAHLMTGNTTLGFLKWLWELFARKPGSLPKRSRPYWYLGVPVIVLGVVIALYSGWAAFLKDLHEGFNIPSLSPVWALLFALASLALSLFVTQWIVPVAGDAARYLSPLPDNVESRQKIREAGVDLLNKLHASGRYDRIVVVGHSLGSVIGYDVLNCAWGRLLEKDLLAGHWAGSDAMKALTVLERATGELVHADEATRGAKREAFRVAQRGYQDALRVWSLDKPPLWAVTDFVTLGAALSKADILMARGEEGFTRRKRARELPACPPILEKDKDKQKTYFLSYPFGKSSRIPHFGAVFAPVVWTNLYFETVDLVFGDPVGGPLRPLFGPGILDVMIPAKAWTFRHCDYWSEPKSTAPWLRALRRAVNLKAETDAALWQGQATAPEIDAMQILEP